MSFEELLDQAGGLGRFQIFQLVLFCITNLLTYPHIVLENFTAAIPDHRCWVQILDNDTISGNETRNLSQDALLRISIPLDSNLKPEKCRRFIHPQWQLLHMNETVTNTAEADTEPCVDGWVYDRSYFPSTIITEWDLVCESQSLKSVVQTLFMTGSLLGSLIYSLLSDSVRMDNIPKEVCGNSPDDVFLQYWANVPRRTGFCHWKLVHTAPGCVYTLACPPLSLQFVKSTIQTELDAVQVKPSIFQLFHAPKVIMRTCCLCFFRFSNAVSFYGLVLNLQHLGSNIFLFQVLFGAIMLTASFLSLWTLNYMGRRTNQIFFSFLAGVSILVNTFLPQEMQTLRVSLATLGIGFVSAAMTGYVLHQIELLPTVFRSILMGIISGFHRIGAIVAPLLMTLLGYSLRLPWIIYGVITLLAGLVILPLPETRNQPLANTIQDVENNTKYSRKVKQEDTSTKVTQF
ncbi:steroid transmembrane transporter SLC22A24-like isoform X5 [Marmota marmota marmota]|uniref:steroid transmembrane transporter SLC22A24-like isoform X5 n=1 Tax=Marmota marmota marmota TaxID=9994 RepID=UPI002093E1A4|nr:steroid transmembrane transporter SLC22A24-like isoform X5 [Marmota marmota marmota]